MAGLLLSPKWGELLEYIVDDAKLPVGLGQGTVGFAQLVQRLREPTICFVYLGVSHRDIRLGGVQARLVAMSCKLTSFSCVFMSASC